MLSSLDVERLRQSSEAERRMFSGLIVLFEDEEDLELFESDLAILVRSLGGRGAAPNGCSSKSMSFVSSTKVCVVERRKESSAESKFSQL